MLMVLAKAGWARIIIKIITVIIIKTIIIIHLLHLKGCCLSVKINVCAQARDPFPLWTGSFLTIKAKSSSSHPLASLEVTLSIKAANLRLIVNKSRDRHDCCFVSQYISHAGDSHKDCFENSIWCDMADILLLWCTGNAVNINTQYMECICRCKRLLNVMLLSQCQVTDSSMYHMYDTYWSKIWCSH